MKAQGVNGTLTVLPVIVAGQPLTPVSEVIAVGLEKRGLQNLELSAERLGVAPRDPFETLEKALASFVVKHPPTTGYVLYAEFNGKPRSGLTELRAIVVDKTGAVVWTDRQTSADPAFKRADAREPMTMAMLLVDRLAPQFGLDAETANAAKPGKFARLMEERSGLPPQAERSALAGRQQTLKAASKTASVVVVSVPAPDGGENAIAGRLAGAIRDAHFFRLTSTLAPGAPLSPSRPNPNEQKMLWDLARQFRSYLKAHPPETDYALCVEFRFDSRNWDHGYVHFVLCDGHGEWVIVDFQNSHHPDYQHAKPTSAAACEALVVKRLAGYLRKE